MKMIRRLIPVSLVAALLFSAAPASAIVVTTVESVTVSKVTKSSAHLRCNFSVASGTYYVRFFTYRTGDRAYRQASPPLSVTRADRYLYTNPDLGGLKSGTQWTVWCQMLKSPGASTAYSKRYTHFTTLPGGGQ